MAATPLSGPRPTGVSGAPSAPDAPSLLRARRRELEQAAFNRVCAIADPVEVSDPHYEEGLKLAVAAALDYGMAALGQRAEESSPPVPDLLLSQARFAARSEVSLDTVLRRYFSGYALLGDFLSKSAGGEAAATGLKRLLESQSSHFDSLLAAVSEAYEEERRSKEERQRSEGSPRRGREEQVRALLSGASKQTSQLAYAIEGRHHTGLTARGEGAERAIREIAAELDRSLLLICPTEGEEIWAWLGGKPLPTERLLERAMAKAGAFAALALGEPAEGLAGWRLTHRQASTALQVARRGKEPLVRYAEVGLLASVLEDELLSKSLKALYLDPLSSAPPDGGRTLRETLAAYLTAMRNVSCTAAALGVDRRTVTRRLRAIEELWGRPLDAVGAEMEVALRLWGVGGITPITPPGNAQS